MPGKRGRQPNHSGTLRQRRADAAPARPDRSAAMTQRTVLIVVHDYPPIRSAGTERVLKFSQYLPEFGYRPIILTTGRYGGYPGDSKRRVYRANDLVHTLFSPFRKRRAEGVAAEDQVRVATVASGSMLGRLRDQLMMPDTKI